MEEYADSLELGLEAVRRVEHSIAFVEYEAVELVLYKKPVNEVLELLRRVGLGRH